MEREGRTSKDAKEVRLLGERRRRVLEGNTSAAVIEVVREVQLVVCWTANVPAQNGYAAIQGKLVRP